MCYEELITANGLGNTDFISNDGNLFRKKFYSSISFVNYPEDVDISTRMKGVERIRAFFFEGQIV